PGGGGAPLREADEQALPLREADRAAQLGGHVGGGEADAELAGGPAVAGAQRAPAAPQSLVGGEGEVEALAEAVGVEADDPALGVDHRPAGRAPGQGRGVLEAAGDAPARGASEGP